MACYHWHHVGWHGACIGTETQRQSKFNFNSNSKPACVAFATRRWASAMQPHCLVPRWSAEKRQNRTEHTTQSSCSCSCSGVRFQGTGDEMYSQYREYIFGFDVQSRLVLLLYFIWWLVGCYCFCSSTTIQFETHLHSLLHHPIAFEHLFVHFDRLSICIWHLENIAWRPIQYQPTSLAMWSSLAE